MNRKLSPIWPLTLAIAVIALARTTLADGLAAPQPVSQIIEEFDIAKGGDIIIVPVTIGDKQYPFVLSVASPRTVVDERLRPLLGKSVGRLDDPASITFDEFRALPMKIRSLAFTPVMPVLCGDLSKLREIFGHELYGIVGLDFLEGRIVQIDFDHGKLRVLSSFPKKLPEGSEFEALWLFEGWYTISLDLSGLPGSHACKIDTLFLQSLMIKTLWMPQMVRGEAFTELHQGYDFKSAAPQTGLRSGLLKSVSFREWTHSNLSVCESVDDRVGLAYLSRFQLTFNFAKGKCVYLTPGAKFDAPELINWSGMELILKHGKATVMFVSPNSVAAKVGVEAGDVIVQLGGHKPEKFNLFEIRQFFMEQNLVHVKFRRPEPEGRAVLEFAVALENPRPIPPLSRPATRQKAKD